MGVLFSRDKATTGIAAMLLRLANLPVRHVFSLAPRRSSPKRTDNSARNFAEWQRKPRRKDRSAA